MRGTQPNHASFSDFAGIADEIKRRTTDTFVRRFMERMKGIEPSTAAWEAAVLPLNYIRINGVTVAA